MWFNGVLLWPYSMLNARYYVSEDSESHVQFNILSSLTVLSILPLLGRSKKISLFPMTSENTDSSKPMKCSLGFNGFICYDNQVQQFKDTGNTPVSRVTHIVRKQWNSCYLFGLSIFNYIIMHWIRKLSSSETYYLILNDIRILS